MKLRIQGQSPHTGPGPANPKNREQWERAAQAARWLPVAVKYGLVPAHAVDVARCAQILAFFPKPKPRRFRCPPREHFLARAMRKAAA